MTLHTTDHDADTADTIDEIRGHSLWARFVPPSVFSDVEERVVALALNDTLASLEAPGPLDRAAAMLFGKRMASRRLADPRLEALRRAVIVARHRHHLPDGEAARLRGLGFADVQLHAIEARAGVQPKR